MSNNSDFIQKIPDFPWWVVFLAFFMAGPLGILLLILKILRESQPKHGQRSSTVHRTYTATSQQFHTGSTANRQGAASVTQNVHYDVRRTGNPNPSTPSQPAASSVAKRPFPYTRIKTGKVFTIAGAILTVIFGITAGSICIEWGFSYPQYLLADLFIPLIFTCGGIGMLIWGRHLASQGKRFKRYLARINNESLIPLRTLSESIPADLDEVYETLQQMIDLGIFGDRAYLDMATETLVIDGAVAKPAPKPQPVKDQAPLSAEDQILAQIRDANDRIPGEEISRKIDRIEEITRHILKYLKKHPERSSELHTFLDYYLPTTLKMLNTYAELDAQQLDGENISVTKERIEQILDKVVEGFEAQLDKLFEGDMLDISADIDVMEKMLERDGLAGELKMPRVSDPAPEQSYTPQLTLTPDQPAPSDASGAAAAPQRRYDDLGTW